MLKKVLAEKDFATLIDIGDKMYGYSKNFGFDLLVKNLRSDFQIKVIVLNL